MRLSVYMTPAQLSPQELSGRVVAVIDVLRASTTIATALAAGARAVIPVESPEEAVVRAKALDRSEVRLAGERRMLAIPGFDLGNSPAEFTPAAVEGRTVVMTTSNGTGALLATAGARDVVVASYVNFSAVLAMLRAALRGGAEIAIVCAGRERQFSLEDAACAGRYVKHIAKRRSGVDMNDAARACTLVEKRYGDNLGRLFAESEHGAALAEAGFAHDLDVCAAVDSCPVVPIYQDRQITKLGASRER